MVSTILNCTMYHMYDSYTSTVGQYRTYPLGCTHNMYSIASFLGTQGLFPSFLHVLPPSLGVSRCGLSGKITVSSAPLDSLDSITHTCRPYVCMVMVMVKNSADTGPLPHYL